MASGDSLLVFTMESSRPPSTDYATRDERNAHHVLDFDAATDESATFMSVMPQSYAGTTGTTIHFGFSMSSATSGNVVVDIAYERTGDAVQDIDSDGFATAQSATVAVAGTSGHVKESTIAFTDGAQMDSVTAGDNFRIKVTRDADNASDTASGDMELNWIEIRET